MNRFISIPPSVRSRQHRPDALPSRSRPFIRRKHRQRKLPYINIKYIMYISFQILATPVSLAARATAAATASFTLGSRALGMM